MRFSYNIYFTLLLCWCLLGVFLYNIIWDVLLALYLYLAFISISACVCFYYRQYAVSCLIILLWLVSWSYISHIEQRTISQNIGVIDKYDELYTQITSRVASVHKRSDFTDEYVMRSIHIGQENINSKISYILKVPKNFVLQPGQNIRHSWKIYMIENFDTFSYKEYMLSQWIYFRMSTTNIDHVWEDMQDIISILYVFREKLLSHIYTMFPKSEAIFLSGILLWARENIPEEVKEDFNNSWLTHFIAVSWFNITLCVIFSTFLFWFLPALYRTITVSAVIISFSFFVWLWAPVVRAAIMWILWYIFLQSWSSIKNITLLAFTALCMVIYSPLSLNYDVSLHLSFLAVIGIIYTQQFFSQIFSFLPSTFAIKEACVLTFAALSFSLPIMIFGFGQVSLLAPLANIAVTWTIPLAMLLWAVSVIFYIISPVLGVIIWFPTWILLKYDMHMVYFFWNIDSALLKLDSWIYSNYYIIAYFLILSYILALFHIKKK